VGEDGISEHSGESVLSGILMKSNKSSKASSPFTLKPKKVENVLILL